MVQHPHIAYLSDVPGEPLRAPGGTCFGGARQRVGAAIGAQKLGYGVFTIPPGKTAFPFHVHGVNEEMIHVLEGRGAVESPKK